MLDQTKQQLAVRSLERTRDRQRAFEYMPPLMAPFLGLPRLRGLWCAANVDSNTDLIDYTGQGRTLLDAGAPGFSVYNDLAPYFGLVPASSQYYSRADEAGLDLTGSHTVGIWVYPNTLGAATSAFLAKHDGSTNAGSNFLLDWNIGAAANLSYGVFSGANAYRASTTGISTGGWYFLVGRYLASTSVSLHVNGVWTTNTTGIPASLNNNASVFEIGGIAGANFLLAANVSVAFLCAAAHSDALISQVYQQTRGWFGV